MFRFVIKIFFYLKRTRLDDRPYNRHVNFAPFVIGHVLNYKISSLLRRTNQDCYLVIFSPTRFMHFVMLHKRTVLFFLLLRNERKKPSNLEIRAKRNNNVIQYLIYTICPSNVTKLL